MARCQEASSPVMQIPVLMRRLHGLQAYRGDDPGAVNKSSKFSADSGTGTGAGTAGTWGKDPEKGIEFGKEKSKVGPTPHDQWSGGRAGTSLSLVSPSQRSTPQSHSVTPLNPNPACREGRRLRRVHHGRHLPAPRRLHHRRQLQALWPEALRRAGRAAPPHDEACAAPDAAALRAGPRQGLHSGVAAPGLLCLWRGHGLAALPLGAVLLCRGRHVGWLRLLHQP